MAVVKLLGGLEYHCSLSNLLLITHSRKITYYPAYSCGVQSICAIQDVLEHEVINP